MGFFRDLLKIFTGENQAVVSPPQRAKAYTHSRKSDWQTLEQIVRKNRIDTLYHFTDHSNLNSIRHHGGLYSWKYCDNHGIIVPQPGGNELSRNLDQRKNLENYVRLSFIRNTPMFYKARSDGRLKNPYILEIDPEVIYWSETLFSDGNATANRTLVGGQLSDFQRIRFDMIGKSDWSNEEEKHYRQAEVLVKTHIPIAFIRNLE